ncbi:DUF2946 domain-containing protein [Allorhodopirellula solitaria]|uniref:Uncharacterized protein n=1 Tax=Allorhodopirellula solitaria TaxID=2527987 RepID=A0A5C5YHU8_9BACT|nr:DUF2946 domain-containing protein [Allorhodopirellula solitaria]TWT73322.1 hypothetical protein CA85_17910 [Allorhodopirellula solitaria]
MTSLVQSIVSTILCCAIAFGHAPAWLHVAGCEDGCGSMLAQVPQSTGAICPHSCCHDTSQPTVSASADESTDSPVSSSVPHDSDTCATCQSLAGSFGVIPPGMVTLSPERASVPVSLSSAEAAVAGSISIAKPRGPPAAV